MSQHIEDTQFASGDHGVAMLAVRRDTAAGPSADGDYATLSVDSSGLLRVVQSAGFTAADQDVTVFASAARTASANSSDLTNSQFRGVALFLDVTAASGTTPTLDIKLQAKDALSGKYFDIPGASFAQKTGTGSDTLTVYPGVAETANETVSDVIPRTWRAVATIGGTSPSFTFSIGASYIP